MFRQLIPRRLILIPRASTTFKGGLCSTPIEQEKPVAETPVVIEIYTVL
jgi:hypothetical protein